VQFDRILFPVDFSEHAKACLSRAASLFGADRRCEVHFLYVLHTPTDFSTWSGDAKADVRKHLDEFLDQYASAGDRIRVAEVRTGHPSTEICKYAEEHDCDAIVMATHGRTGLSHMLLGSTAEQVVRHAPCAVLTWRVRTG